MQITGWRKVKCIRQQVKSRFRHTSNIVFKRSIEEVKKKVVKEYLREAQKLILRFEQSLTEAIQNGDNQSIVATLSLQNFINYAKIFIDQIDRRLLQNQTIPMDEKILSIFEKEVEWITKGKLNKRVELGHLILITTNKNNLIVDYKVILNERDAAQVPTLMERMKSRYPQGIHSMSFDKAFFSKENFECLQQAEVEHVVMPKKGKKNLTEQQYEGTKKFKILRNKHSAIESSNNMLEHHGANHCPDKGHKNYCRYITLCVLANNLHIIGNHLLKKGAVKKQRQYKQAA